MEKPVFKMFEHRTNFELLALMRRILDTKLTAAGLMVELCEQDGGSKSSQYRSLNKLDLLQVIYAAILPEIIRIDTAPLEQIPILLNEEWPCEELKERLIRRLKNGVER